MAYESTKALREERAKALKTARDLLDKADAEKRELTAEEDGKFKQLHDEERKLAVKIERLESQEKAEADLRAAGDGEGDKGKGGKPGLENADGKQNRQREAGDADAGGKPTEEDRALCMQGWIRRMMGKRPSDEQKTAAQKCGVNLKRNAFDLTLPTYRNNRVPAEYRGAALQRRADIENRAQSAFQGTGGAYTIPEGFMANLEVALLAYWDPRGSVDVWRTDSGQDVPWPTVNDTTVKGALISENTQVNEVDVSFSQVIFHAYKATSNIVLVPAELLEDSAFNLASWLGDAFGIRIGRLQADLFTTGTGVGQPQGVVTAATLGYTFASDTAIYADEIYNLKHSVDPAYRRGASFMFHDNTLLWIKKLKDGAGRYLFQASLAGGAPDTLDDDPIVINQSMQQIGTTGYKTMLYGQLQKYKIREVNQVRMRRLVERYADKDQEGFVLFVRFDGNLLDAGTHPIKYGVHP